MRKIYVLIVFLFSLANLNLAQDRSQENKEQLPIGIFDSGTGGLTVLQAILTLDSFHNKTGLPGGDGKPDFANEAFQYLGDQANMPYGNYAAENKIDLLQEHILKNVDFLLNNTYEIKKGSGWIKKDKPDVKLIVVACNTATAYALNKIENYLSHRDSNVSVIGVINAGVKAALQYQKNHEGTIGVFATAGTVVSNGYPNAIKNYAAEMNLSLPPIVNQGGVGLAESIDRDWNYFNDTLTTVRKDYKGPSIKNSQLPIDTNLLPAYNFNRDKNNLLCEYNASGECIDIQLNDPANYVRYHLVSLLEKMKRNNYTLPLSTLILGCTHYPYLKDTIKYVLNELYNFQENGNYKYRKVLDSHVELIDPAVETAIDAYKALRKKNLQKESYSNIISTFFISIPNTELKEIQLQTDGWFTYKYKYGREGGTNKKYVRYVPFDSKNIAEATYQRFSSIIPNVYIKLKEYVKELE